jgi:hypothetical protein
LDRYTHVNGPEHLQTSPKSVVFASLLPVKTAAGLQNSKISTCSIQAIHGQNSSSTGEIKRPDLQEDRNLPCRHLDDATVLVADNSATLGVLQNTVDIQPNMLAARVTTNEVRSMDESRIDFDRIAWLRTEEGIF